MVFDGSKSPYRSTDQPNPLSEYGRQKLEAEKAILSVTDENLVVLRITLVNGNSPGGTRSQHEKILHALANNEPLVMFEDEVASHALRKTSLLQWLNCSSDQISMAFSIGRVMRKSHDTNWEFVFFGDSE